MADRYSDEERFRDEERAGRRYRGGGYYGGYYGPSERQARFRAEYGRGEYGRGQWGRTPDREDRGFFERAGDEVRSWFGDEEAERRRERDEREYERERGWPAGWGESRHGDDRRWGGYGGRERDDERDWARQWGYVEGRGPRGRERYQPSEWSSPERQFERSPRGWSYSEVWLIGPFSGLGPRGYQRSDDRIKEDLCERLSQHGHLDASDMEVRVLNGEVTLVGSVRQRQDKRMAEDIAESVPGVRDVQNQLRVSQSATGFDAQQPQGQPWGGEQRGNRAA